MSKKNSSKAEKTEATEQELPGTEVKDIPANKEKKAPKIDWQMAAKDVSKLIDPEVKGTDEEIQERLKKELKEIRSDDALQPGTWVALKSLGWGEKKATKPAAAPKAKAEKAPKSEKKPGVIATILALIKKKAMVKEDILKELVERFPDRKEESMSKTIQAQLPSRMAKERGLTITSKDGKFYCK